MRIKNIIHTGRVILDQGLQATEASLDLFVQAQQHGAETVHEVIETSMQRSQEACMGGLTLWKNSLRASTDLAQGLTKRIRAGVAPGTPAGAAS